MTIRSWLRVDDGDVGGALHAFLKTLMESGQVEALLAPCRPPVGVGIVPVLIEDADLLSRCDLLAPVMSANMATLVSRLTNVDTGRRLGVVLRSCELRALVELTKLHQITLDHVTTIGVDCLGTYDVADYAALARAGCQPNAIWAGAPTGEPTLVDGYSLRTACQMCEHPVPEGADIRIGLIGLPDADAILVESEGGLALPPETAPADVTGRERVITALIERHLIARERILGAWRT